MAPDTLSRVDSSSAPRAVFATEWVRGRTKRTGATALVARRESCLPRILPPPLELRGARPTGDGPILAANLGVLALTTRSRKHSAPPRPRIGHSGRSLVPREQRERRPVHTPRSFATALRTACRRHPALASRAAARSPSASFCSSVRSSFPLSLSVYLPSTSMCRDHELADKIPYGPNAHNTGVAAQATIFLWR
jgi:hypothetical protein